MTDYLAQTASEGTFTPEQLFAGEGPIVTQGGKTVPVGQNLARFQFAALNESGEMVAWNPAAGAASAVLNFTGVGTAADTITINGQAITLVAAAAATYEVTIGASATLTAQAVKAKINAYPDTFGVVASGDAAALTLTAIEPGVVGNSIAVAESGTGTNFTGAVTALAGGSEETEALIYGLTLHAYNATGGALTGGACYIECPPINHEAVTWPAGLTTLAARQLALYRAGGKFTVNALG